MTFLLIFFLIISIFSLLALKYKSKSVFLLNFDFWFNINFLIFSELLLPPGSLIFKKLILFFVEPDNPVRIETGPERKELERKVTFQLMDWN